MTDLNVSATLFSQAAVLMMVGMGFVFAFLGLLIIAIKTIIAPLANRFPDPQADSKNNNGNQNSSAQVVAAISVAIDQYRQKHK